MKIKQIFKLLKQIKKAKQYILITQDNSNNIQSDESDNLDNEFLLNISTQLKNNVINNIGINEYSQKLQQYDPELFNAYKEADYQMVCSDYYKAELDYYKVLNDPMSGDANISFSLYKRLQEKKKQMENFK